MQFLNSSGAPAFGVLRAVPPDKLHVHVSKVCASRKVHTAHIVFNFQPQLVCPKTRQHELSADAPVYSTRGEGAKVLIMEPTASSCAGTPAEHYTCRRHLRSLSPVVGQKAGPCLSAPCPLPPPASARCHSPEIPASDLAKALSWSPCSWLALRNGAASSAEL